MSTRYLVRQGDSLWNIAKARLGNPMKWPEIARANQLQNPDRLYIGQELILPARSQNALATQNVGAQPSIQMAKHPANQVMGRAFFYVIADEINPFTKKFVRRVAIPMEVTDGELIRKIVNPDVYGFSPRSPGSRVSMAGHVKGMTNSKFISMSEFQFGALRHEGTSYWIDAKKLRQAGVEVIPHDALVANIQEAIAAEKTRLNFRIANNNSPNSIANLERSLATYERALGHAITDGEVLAAGDIPAAAVKGSGRMVLTRSLQIVGITGVIWTTYDLGDAGWQSIQQGSVKPFSREATKQGAGWAGGAVGRAAGTWAGRRAGMWLGARIGGVTGTAFTVETGPGAAIGAVVGTVVGGFVGFFWGPEIVAEVVPESMRSYVLPDD